MKLQNSRWGYSVGAAAFAAGSLLFAPLAGATNESDPDSAYTTEADTATTEGNAAQEIQKAHSEDYEKPSKDYEKPKEVESEGSKSENSEEPKPESKDEPTKDESKTDATETGRECIKVEFGTRLIDPTVPSSSEKPVDIAAGSDVAITAHSNDAYANRATTKAQTSERWNIEFLDANGAVVATSGTTEDVEDGVESAEWSGSLGSVSADTDIKSARVKHQPNDDGTPNSVNVDRIVLCVTATPTTEETVAASPIPTAVETTQVVTTDPATTDTPTTTEAGEPTTEVTTDDSSVTEPTVLGTTQTEVAAAPKPSLPRTGSESNQLALAGLGIAALGGLMVFMGRLRSARSTS